MKQRFTIIAIVCLLLIGWVGCTSPSSSGSKSTPTPDNRSWAPLGAAGFSSGGVTNISLAVSSAGTVYAAYNDAAQGGKTTVQRFTGSSWELVGAAGFGPTAITHIALDASDQPYLVYDDPANQTQALAIRFDGAAWQTAGSAAYGVGTDVTATAAASGGGNLFAAFGDLDADNRPLVFQRTGSTWTALAPSPASLFDQLNFHWSGALAVDGAGTPYLATADDTVDGKATVMKWTGTNWTRVGAQGFSVGGESNGDAVYLPSLAFDSANRPYLAYIQDQAGLEPKVTVMKFDGTGWALVGPAGISPAVVEASFIVIDSRNIPFVSYVHTVNTGPDEPWPLEVLKYDGKAWVGTGTGGAGVVGMTKDAFSDAFVKGPSGAVYLAFPDSGAGDRLTVLAYR